jgi:hypothetical protein
MISLVLLAVLAAPAEHAQLRLASPGLSYVQLEDKVGDFFSDYFAQQLVLQGIRVTTKNEVSALLGFERQKELLGCSEKSSTCLAEMAGALGVDGLITGNLAKFGQGFAINLKIVSAKTGQVMGAYTGRLKGDEALLDWLTETAKAFAVAQGKPVVAAADAPKKVELQPTAVANSAPATVEAKPFVRSKWWLVPGGAGVVLLGLGAATLASAGTEAQNILRDGGISSDVFTKRAGDAVKTQQIGFGFLGAGVVAAGVAATVFALSGESAPPVSMSVQPEGGAIVWAGELP